jgi:uncharacterized phage protein gp47/JayE
MPWTTPTLSNVRSMVRDAIRGQLPGADANVPNSVLRVVSDAMGALCHLVLQYVDWLALQLLPDTAETEWLDRHGAIWLINADGSTGRKMATPASGTATFVGQPLGTVVPQATQLLYGNVSYETTQQYEVNDAGGDIPIQSLVPGTVGNEPPGTLLTITSTIPGLVPTATVVTLSNGTDTETDDELRARVLQRIRQPPQGGAANDYVRWALAVPGCTRAWCAPNEMGIGTVTVRVLFDDLRADNDGWPRAEDLQAVTDYIDSVRPVAVKDFWVLAPIKQYVDVHIRDLVPDTPATRAAIETALLDMLYERAAPGQTIFAVWKAEAIMNNAPVVSFDLTDWTDDVMANAGSMAVLRDIYYG